MLHDSHHTFVNTGMGIGSAPGPPLPLRSVVAQERSSFDKVMYCKQHCVR